MREYDVDKTVKKVICNMCGKELKVENGVVVEGPANTSGDIFRKRTGRYIGLIFAKNVMIR